ncbi:MAG: hypothetical protein A3G75_15905, partial [Verrucomicrobia bacterium RIFCSPLOWO2_12_FULL_64_8]
YGGECGGDWFGFCLRLAEAGYFNRVCAAVRLRMPVGWRDYRPPAGNVPAATTDPFYNPHFRADPADYSLGPGASRAEPGFMWHLDSPPPATAETGGVRIRGWCFRPDGRPVIVTAKTNGMRWFAPCEQSRPDVKAAFPGLAGVRCGFSILLRLPSGIHGLTLAAESPGTAPQELLRQSVRVPRLAALRRLMSSDRSQLVAFQLNAGPLHPPCRLSVAKFPPRPMAAGPRFSIVTPSLQDGRWLEETMLGVLNQPGVAGEYVVQDGGSTDGSVAVIERMAEISAAKAIGGRAGPNSSAIRLAAWESAPDGGQAAAIARGFAKTTGASGDLMAWINSDDFYLPGALRFVAGWFAGHPDVDVLYSHRLMVDENSMEIGRWFLPPQDPAILRLNDFVPQETLFWRRRIWDKVGGLDPTFRFAMDWDLLLRFQAAGARIVRVPYFLACFRIHPRQKTAAEIDTIGRKEIEALRTRANGHPISPVDLESDGRLHGYLRRSAWIELWWKLGIRAP